MFWPATIGYYELLAWTRCDPAQAQFDTSRLAVAHTSEPPLARPSIIGWQIRLNAPSTKSKKFHNPPRGNCSEINPLRLAYSFALSHKTNHLCFAAPLTPWQRGRFGVAREDEPLNMSLPAWWWLINKARKAENQMDPEDKKRMRFKVVPSSDAKEGEGIQITFGPFKGNTILPWDEQSPTIPTIYYELFSPNTVNTHPVYAPSLEMC